MFALAGVALIIAGHQMGLSFYFDYQRIELAQVLFVAGVTVLTTSLLNYFKAFIEAIFAVGALLIGLAVFGFMGVYERDLIGIIGGSAIVAAWARMFFSNRRGKSKGKKKS